MNEIIGLVFMILGSLFYVLAGLGLVRMPDAFNRIQAGTKATTLGTFTILIGVGIYDFASLPKALVIIVLIALTNPIGSSQLARTAYKNGERGVAK